jgi:hypothetical protein
VDDWTFSVENIFNAYSKDLPDRERVALASTRLKGQALTLVEIACPKQPGK